MHGREKGVFPNESARSVFGREQPLGKRLKTKDNDGRMIGEKFTGFDSLVTERVDRIGYSCLCCVVADRDNSDHQSYQS